MKERLIGFLKTYFLFVCIFMLQKPLFMFFYQTLYEGASWTEWFRVIWHGLPLDLSLAGYLTAVPGLLFIGSAWGLSNLLRRIWCGYFILFLSYFLSYSPSIWDCMNIGASGWMLPLCSTSFPLPKMRWRASASGWWSEGFLQWASMRRFYMEYSIGCCCGKPFSDG